jgi:hypothetical protein
MQTQFQGEAAPKQAGYMPRQDILYQLNLAVSAMNEAISSAVDAGITIEMVRASRYHDGRGNWGDLMRPTIPKSVLEGPGRASQNAL